jgi:hypothetical protein
MCESIVVVGAALSADVDAPTERVHSAPGARRGQSPKQPTGERGGRENAEEFRVGSRNGPLPRTEVLQTSCLSEPSIRKYRRINALHVRFDRIRMIYSPTQPTLIVQRKNK